MEGDERRGPPQSASEEILTRPRVQNYDQPQTPTTTLNFGYGYSVSESPTGTDTLHPLPYPRLRCSGFRTPTPPPTVDGAKSANVVVLLSSFHRLTVPSFNVDIPDAIRLDIKHLAPAAMISSFPYAGIRRRHELSSMPYDPIPRRAWNSQNPIRAKMVLSTNLERSILTLPLFSPCNVKRTSHTSSISPLRFESGSMEGSYFDDSGGSVALGFVWRKQDGMSRL